MSGHGTRRGWAWNLPIFKMIRMGLLKRNRLTRFLLFLLILTVYIVGNAMTLSRQLLHGCPLASYGSLVALGGGWLFGVMAGIISGLLALGIVLMLLLSTGGDAGQLINAGHVIPAILVLLMGMAGGWMGRLYRAWRFQALQLKRQQVSLLNEMAKRLKTEKALLQHEKALRETEESASRILDIIPIGMHFYHLHPDGRLVLVRANQAADRILGLEHNPLIGLTIEAAFPGIRRDLPDAYRMVARTGETRIYEETHYRDGRLSGVFSVVAFRSQPGHVVASFLDVTDRFRAHEVMRMAKEELERRVEERTAELGRVNRELESFVYSVSHDLRAPLQNVIGFAEALTEDYDVVLDLAGKQYLGYIGQSVKKMRDMLDGLLELSRADRSVMHRTTVDLAAMARDIVRDLAVNNPGREVNVEIPSALPAEGDPRMLRDMLWNLLGNAWKFTRQVDPARIMVTSYQKDGEWIYQVQDNGAGFDMQYADKLFTPFKRLHGETTFEGTGIGLSVVRRIVERHGGRIWALGEPGKGATFLFTLGTARAEDTST